MCVNDKRLKAEVACASIQVAIMLLMIIRMPPACNAEYTNALSTYDPNSVANARKECVGELCCSPPYEIVQHQRPLWSFLKSKYSCCVPKLKQDKTNCCPHPLIPSKEPNMDPGFGPFCCDPENGHCCSKMKYEIPGSGEPYDYVFTVPRGGKCCATYPNALKEKCCPRPLFKVDIEAPLFLPLGRMKRLPLCCSFYNPVLCVSDDYHYDEVPSPRFCSPREFCCPFPYFPRIEIISPYTYIDGVPQYYAKWDNKCMSPGFTTCTLPQVPWYKSCIEQQFAVEVSQEDAPLYEIAPLEFSSPDPSKTAASSKTQCLKNDVFRRAFGTPFLKSESHSVAIDWFVTSPYVQRSKLLNETYVREQIWMWPGVIIPFIFPITIFTMSVATALPALLLGAICWALVFNVRFLWIKQVRMAIRRIFVCIEKRRRIIQDNYLPPEDQRKFHARDRYQLPKALQDSDRSDDDEPEDLKRTHVDVIESHWTVEEIDALGFDPDNIPVDWIYGDLLGNPSALRKEVKAYNSAAKASGKPMLIEDDETMKQLDFEEWLHFLCNRETNDKDYTAQNNAKLDRKRSIQRYKGRKKISRRRKIHVRIKRSEKVHESPSKAEVDEGKKKDKSKHEKKKKSRRKRAK